MRFDDIFSSFTHDDSTILCACFRYENNNNNNNNNNKPLRECVACCLLRAFGLSSFLLLERETKGKNDDDGGTEWSFSLHEKT